MQSHMERKDQVRGSSMSGAKKDEFYSPVRKIMVSVMLAGAGLCLLFAVLYRAKGQDWLLSCAISFGVLAYHIAIRFLSPVLVSFCSGRKYDHNSWWFRQKKWEPALYERLRVKSWKEKAFTYDPSEFSLKVHSLEEIVVNMCHAELVHETIALFSFSSLLFAIPFGAFGVFCATAVAAALFDMSFVVLQRYNRPRVLWLMERRRK